MKLAQFAAATGVVRWLSYAILTLLLTTVWLPVSATSTIPPPDISVFTARADGMSPPSFRALADAFPYEFGAEIKLGWGPNVEGDVYFGILEPGGQRAHTWRYVDGELVLQPGMQPIRKISLREPATINLSLLHGKAITHAFAPDAPRGMYTVFALIVTAGSDPSNTLRWYGVDMAPLFVDSGP